MRLANVQGRWHILVDGGGVDVEAASAGRFPADPLGLLERWPEFRDWAPTPTSPMRSRWRRQISALRCHGPGRSSPSA